MNNSIHSAIPYRDPRGHVVSVAFFGVVRPRDFQPVANSDAADVAWFNMKKLPKLAFDHKKIIDAAIKRLSGKLMYEPVGFELLDREFPFSDLVKLYQTLLDKDLDRTNFRKKLMSLGLVEESDRVVNRGAGRPARLFRFNRKKYFELKEKGYHSDMFFLGECGRSTESETAMKRNRHGAGVAIVWELGRK